MKISIKRIAPLLIIVAALFTSCLEGDETNFPTESSGSPMLELIYNPSEGATINSGLYYFTGAALQFSVDDPNDTTSFVVSIQGGGGTLSSDLGLSLKIDEAALLNNYSTDSTDYILMTDDQYEFINTTATIKAGETSAEFKVIFKPSQFTDPTISYNLPVTVAYNKSDLPISANYGHIYFHVIGNPIAGTYNWDFIRYSNPEATGNPDSQTVYGRTATLAPVGPTSINVPTGYYNKPNYLITFTNSAGVLSNFKAVIDPDEIQSYFTDNGITVTSGPKITIKDVNGNVLTKGTADDIYSYTINYTTVTRNCTDIFYK